MTRNGWLLAGGVLLLFFLVPLGLHGLWIPDETRYAQIAQGMLHSGDWLSPRFLGLRYFEKPSGGYWPFALGQALFGENLFGVRIASVAVTTLSALLVLWMGRRLWPEQRTGAIAALLFGSFGLVAGQAGYANLDPAFSLWTTLSLVALWEGLEAESRNRRLLGWALLGLACALGMMTKGFLAGLLPVLVALPYALLFGHWRRLLGYGALAVLVAVLVCAPWAWATHQREPDFWNFFFWHEHIRRFAGSDAQHAQPFWFFVPLLLVSALPWTLLLAQGARHAWRERQQRGVAFLGLWFLMPFLFFSLAKGKLPTYILPCFAPLALLLAHALRAALADGRLRLLRLNGGFNLVLGLLGLGAFIWMQLRRPLYHDETTSVLLILAIIAVWVLCAALQAWRPRQFWAAPALGLWMLVALLPCAVPLNVVNSKTPDQFIAQHLDALRGARSLLSNDLGTASALAWRLNRTDIELFDTEGELQYGLAQPDGAGRNVGFAEVGPWMEQARRLGPVGVVLRVNSPGDEYEMSLLPKDADSYRENHLVILLLPALKP